MRRRDWLLIAKKNLIDDKKSVYACERCGRKWTTNPKLAHLGFQERPCKCDAEAFRQTTLF